VHGRLAQTGGSEDAGQLTTDVEGGRRDAVQQLNRQTHRQPHERVMRPPDVADDQPPARPQYPRELVGCLALRVVR